MNFDPDPLGYAMATARFPLRIRPKCMQMDVRIEATDDTHRLLLALACCDVLGDRAHSVLILKELRKRTSDARRKKGEEYKNRTKANSELNVVPFSYRTGVQVTLEYDTDTLLMALAYFEAVAKGERQVRTLCGEILSRLSSDPAAERSAA